MGKFHNQTFSDIIDREKVYGKKGRKPYNREQIYRFLYDNSDHRGIVIYTQNEVADMLHISRQNISLFFVEFCLTGHLKKHSGGRNVFFEVMYDPDELVWDDYYDKLDALKKGE